MALGAQLVDQCADLYHLLVYASLEPFYCGSLGFTDALVTHRMLLRFHAMKKQLLRAQRRDD